MLGEQSATTVARQARTRGAPGAPSSAAPALSVGLKNGTAAGDVSAWPTGGAANSSPTFQYLSSGAVTHGVYQGALSSSGQVTFQNNGSQPVTMTLGSERYFLSPATTPAGSTFVDVPQAVAASTTTGAGGITEQAIPANGSITFQVEGANGIPSTGVSAVVEDMRAYQAQASGFLSVYAAGASNPGQPGVNFSAGMDQGDNLTIPMVSASGEQTITNNSSGTVNVIVALRGFYASPAAPTSPVSVAATISGQTATVTWAAPAGDGGSPVTGYTVTAPPDTASVIVDGNTYQATLTGLTNPSADSFSVAATNVVGAGAAGSYGPTDQTLSGTVLTPAPAASPIRRWRTRKLTSTTSTRTWTQPRR